MIAIANDDPRKTAPMAGCNCDICIWARARAMRERRLDADLRQNYAKFVNGQLRTPASEE